jgi:hypothetical protein
LRRIHSIPAGMLSASLFMFVLAAAPAAAQRAHIGVGAGYNFESRDPLLAFQATLPLVPRLDFYPSIDVYFPDRGARTAFNFDMRVRFPESVGPSFYMGGGLGVLHRNVADVSRNDTGADFLFGLESRSSWVHPFIEGRALLNNNSSFQITGGLNLTLGRP